MEEKDFEIEEEFYNRLVLLNSEFFHMPPEHRIGEIIKYVTNDMYFFFDMKIARKIFIKLFSDSLKDAEIKYKKWKEERELENE